LEQGEPKLLDDGKFVRPFLNDEDYKLIINNMFDDDAYDNFRVQRPGRSYSIKLRYVID
jgi:hypothetical protein